MKRAKFFWSWAIIFVMVGQIFSQAPVTRTPRTNVDPNRQDTATQRWYEELRRRENMPTGIGSVNESTLTLIAKLRKEALTKLEPTEEEKRAFAELSNQSGTEFIKLAAETDCTKILDISKPNLECLNYYIEGKALAFSFRKKRYTHEAYADLERLNGKFVAPGTYILGLMSDLGDIPFENLDLSDETVSALLKFSPANDIDGIIRQEKEIAKGAMIGGSTFRKNLPITANSTYLLRSVAYRAKFKNLPKDDSRKGSLDDDDRSDVIVAFKVLRKNFDDTLLIVWKEINRRDAPKIEVDLGK